MLTNMSNVRHFKFNSKWYVINWVVSNFLQDPSELIIFSRQPIDEH